MIDTKTQNSAHPKKLLAIAAFTTFLGTLDSGFAGTTSTTSTSIEQTRKGGEADKQEEDLPPFPADQSRKGGEADKQEEDLPRFPADQWIGVTDHSRPSFSGSNVLKSLQTGLNPLSGSETELAPPAGAFAGDEWRQVGNGSGERETQSNAPTPPLNGETDKKRYIADLEELNNPMRAGSNSGSQFEPLPGKFPTVPWRKEVTGEEVHTPVEPEIKLKATDSSTGWAIQKSDLPHPQADLNSTAVK